MELASQVKLCKQYGFKFSHICYNDKIGYRAIMRFNNNFLSNVVLNKAMTKETLIQELTEKRADILRSQFKLILGGLAWLPSGVKSPSREVVRDFKLVVNKAA